MTAAAQRRQRQQERDERNRNIVVRVRGRVVYSNFHPELRAVKERAAVSMGMTLEEYLDWDHRRELLSQLTALDARNDSTLALTRT